MESISMLTPTSCSMVLSAKRKERSAMLCLSCQVCLRERKQIRAQMTHLRKSMRNRRVKELDSSISLRRRRKKHPRFNNLSIQCQSIPMQVNRIWWCNSRCQCLICSLEWLQLANGNRCPMEQQVQMECLLMANLTWESPYTILMTMQMTSLMMRSIFNTLRIKPSSINSNIIIISSMSQQWMSYIDLENQFGPSAAKACSLRMMTRWISMGQYGSWWLL